MASKTCGASGSDNTELFIAWKTENVPQHHSLLALFVLLEPERLKGEEGRFLRKPLGYSQEELATAMGMTRLTVMRWESGKQFRLEQDKYLRRLYLAKADQDLKNATHSPTPCWRAGLVEADRVSVCASFWSPPPIQLGMITGVVTEAREAVIRVAVRGPTGQDLQVDAVVDTGFDGWLTLPPEVIAQLELPWRPAPYRIMTVPRSNEAGSPKLS